MENLKKDYTGGIMQELIGLSDFVTNYKHANPQAWMENKILFEGIDRHTRLIADEITTVSTRFELSEGNGIDLEKTRFFHLISELNRFFPEDVKDSFLKLERNITVFFAGLDAGYYDELCSALNFNDIGTYFYYMGHVYDAVAYLQRGVVDLMEEKGSEEPSLF